MKRAAAVPLLLAYAGSVVLANWLVTRYGLISVGFGLVAPAGIPPEAMAWLAKQVGVAMRSPEIVAKVQELGMEVANLDATASKAFIADEVAKWASIVKLTGATND